MVETKNPKTLLNKLSDDLSGRNLSKPQSRLLSKLIMFDAMSLDEENDPIKKRLYDLFFNWKTQGDKEEEEEQGNNTDKNVIEKQREEDRIEK